MNLPLLLTIVGMLGVFALQCIAFGIAYGDIRARITAIENKISGNGTYLPRAEATLMVEAAKAARERMQEELDELRAAFHEWTNNGKSPN